MAMPTTLPNGRLDEGSLSLSVPATCAGVTVRALGGYVDGIPGEALPCYRISDKIVVKCSKCDGGLQQFRFLRQPR